MRRILFVCMGNICRSPTAEGVFRQLARAGGREAEFVVDSAGTHDYHEGAAPDRRAQSHALKRGYDLSALRARQVRHSDFTEFDQILAMDRRNLADLQRVCPPAEKHRLRLFLDYAKGCGVTDVPDPYGGGEQGFETVLDLVEAAVRGILREPRTEG